MINIIVKDMMGDYTEHDIVNLKQKILDSMPEDVTLDFHGMENAPHSYMVSLFSNLRVSLGMRILSHIHVKNLSMEKEILSDTYKSALITTLADHIF